MTAEILPPHITEAMVLLFPVQHRHSMSETVMCYVVCRLSQEKSAVQQHQRSNPEPLDPNSCTLQLRHHPSPCMYKLYTYRMDGFTHRWCITHRMTRTTWQLLSIDDQWYIIPTTKINRCIPLLMFTIHTLSRPKNSDKEDPFHLTERLPCW